MLQPRVALLGFRGVVLREQRAGFRDARLQLRALRCLFRAEHFHEGLKGALGIRQLRVQSRLFVGIEVSVERVVLILRDRIELVVVTTSTVHRQTKEHRGRRAGAIGCVFDEVLLIDRAAFIRDHMVTVEAAGHFVFLRGFGQQIARNLRDHELVEGHVVLVRLQHPIAPRPQRAPRIHVNAVRIGVARSIQPRQGHALGIARAVRLLGHELLCQALPAIRLRRSHVAGHFFRRGRQTSQIQVQAAHQQGLVGARC